MAMIHRRLLASIAMSLAAGTAAADPPGPVTACASDTQIGAGLNLAQALAAGGVIRFACQPGSTIRVTGHYTLHGSTLIDGGDAVTLDGHGGVGPMLSASENVILRRLTVRGFAQKPIVPTPGKSLGRITGSVLAASGDAELDRVTIEASDFPIDVGGTATVKDSAFVGNRGGLAVAVRGTAHVDRSRVTGGSQTLSISGGWVRECTFTDLTTGAVSIREASAPVEIRHSTFAGTRGRPALALSQQAGLRGPQTITVRANVFRDNDGGTAAGAISLFDVAQDARDRGQSASVIGVLAALPPASFVLGYNRFTGNRGGRGGAIAADLAHTGGMISTGDLFVGNTAGGDGGAIVVSGGALHVSHALFKANRAGARGAALAVSSNASATIANALVVGNAGPSGTIEGSAVTVTNVTIADNEAAGLRLDASAARAANVLLAHNRPADCAQVPAGVFRGGGLQSDGSCPGVAVGDAFLDAFYVPAAGSPALRAGDPAICRGSMVGGVDLPFQGRPGRDGCALGAFERAPLRKFSFTTDRREPHADKRDDFTDDEGYRPAPGPPAHSPAAAYQKYTIVVVIGVFVILLLVWRARRREGSLKGKTL